MRTLSAGEIDNRPWRELLAPHIARFDAADAAGGSAAGGSAVYNAVGSRAMAALLAEIADCLDRARLLAIAKGDKLVEFFRSPEGYARFGWHGDQEGWAPQETAIRAMREFIASKSVLERRRPTVEQISDARTSLAAEFAAQLRHGGGYDEIADYIEESAALRDELSRALTAARIEGERAGMERAAKVADGYCENDAVSVRGVVAVQHVAAAIRALAKELT